MTTITKQTIKGFNSLLESGASNTKLEGFLLFEDVAKKDAIAYLKERGLIGKVTFRGWLYQRCETGYLGTAEFAAKLAEGSNNEQKHISTYNNERRAFNSIHAKYNEAVAAEILDEDTLIKLDVDAALKAAKKAA